MKGCVSIITILLILGSINGCRAVVQESVPNSMFRSVITPEILIELKGDSSASMEEIKRYNPGDIQILNNEEIIHIFSGHYGFRDHSMAKLFIKRSQDLGTTWTDIQPLFDEKYEINSQCVSLNMISDSVLMLVYLEKCSIYDCRPVVRFSSDTKSWSNPIQIIPDIDSAYYVVNNDRIIITDSGRIIVPVSKHDYNELKSSGIEPKGSIYIYFSDDNGATWNKSSDIYNVKNGDSLVLQEPGVVEIGSDSLLCYMRSKQGFQYYSHSYDKGITWTRVFKSNLESPLSPAKIVKLENGELLCIWNDYSNRIYGLEGVNDNIEYRTPLSLSISTDNGETWNPSASLFNNPKGWYCYPAIQYDELNQDIYVSSYYGTRFLRDCALYKISLN